MGSGPGTTADDTVIVSWPTSGPAACPACSAVYKRDARQLVLAGLAGGKGIADTITGHPCGLATLTARGFPVRPGQRVSNLTWSSP
jgi:Replication initiator protein, pSAM2